MCVSLGYGVGICVSNGVDISLGTLGVKVSLGLGFGFRRHRRHSLRRQSILLCVHHWRRHHRRCLLRRRGHNSFLSVPASVFSFGVGIIIITVVSVVCCVGVDITLFRRRRHLSFPLVSALSQSLASFTGSASILLFSVGVGIVNIIVGIVVIIVVGVVRCVGADISFPSATLF